MKLGRSKLLASITYTLQVDVVRVYVIHTQQWIDPAQPYTLTTGNFNSRWQIVFEETGLPYSIETFLGAGTKVSIKVNGVVKWANLVRWESQSGVRTAFFEIPYLSSGDVVVMDSVVSPDGVTRWKNAI